jgi:hypothetical protein
MRGTAGLTWIVFTACSPVLLLGQHDPLQKGADVLHKATGKQVSVQFEERTRWEERYGNEFGKSIGEQNMLSRLRIGMLYHLVSWLTISGMGQDTRAPFYGGTPPGSDRDTMDLQESWVLLNSASTGLHFSFGRRMLNYGEKRVIGTPQWSNSSRTYDYGRVNYTAKKMSLEALLVSPVVIQPDAFNSPNLGNRIWGTYEVFSRLWRGMSIDAFGLRHSQNKIGGWKGAGTLGTNSFGVRVYGPLPHQFTYDVQGIGQNGHLGTPEQRAYAYYFRIARPVEVGKLPVSLSAIYKAASGSHEGSGHSATYDQLSPANHDKFGHIDLFGWRNLKTFKSLDTVNLPKRIAFNLMYTDEYLFSASDAVYAGDGSQLAISKSGSAGTHVGRELDAFMTFVLGNNTFLAGYGQFFKGDFVQNATPGINPRYLYVAQQYNIK